MLRLESYSMRTNTKIGLLVLIVSVLLLFWVIPHQVPESPGERISPSFFPTAVIAVTAVLACLLIFTSRIHSETFLSVPLDGKKRVAGVILLTGLYLIAMRYLGYVVPSVLTLALLIRLFGEKRYLLVFAVSAFTVVAIFVLFGRIFTLMMPRGLLTPLFEFLIY
jgi:hypothetical protein